MRTRPPMLSRRWLDARPLAAGVLLVVAALALLGYWAWQASIRRHEVTLDLLRSHADLAAQRLGARMQNELYVSGMAIFRPVLAAANESAIDPRSILDAARDAERCKCTAPMRPAYALRTDLTNDGTTFAGKHVPAVAGRSAIVSALRRQLESMPPGWHIAALRTEASDGRIVLFTRIPHNDRAEYIGFATDSSTVREFVVWPLICHTRLVNADSGARVSPNDSLVAIRLADARGTEIYRTRTPLDTELASTVTFPIEWGELALSASLRPEAIELVLPGGVPRSPIPTLVALVLAAGTLAGLAVLLLWRMHELSRLRTDFTSSVSHELRTPLTQILLYAETIELGRQRSRAKRAEAIGVITRETRRLIHLVENVLQFSRAERHLTRLSPRLHDVGELVAEAVNGFLPVAESRGTTVALRLGASVRAAADGDAVRRILLNLLDNAVRYGPDGQTVVVGVERAGSWARITVADEGPGIAPHRRDDVWRPFVRLDGSDDGSATGCGIGLAIVSELVELHGGRRSIVARDGGGTVFVIELPAATIPTEPLDRVPDESALGAAAR